MSIENASRNGEPYRGRGVTAVLGPTNTGKTHLAIERMLGHESGMIGLPLRLLAREVYDKLVARAGSGNVALITGEERIKPERPRYYVCTVEAMPREVDVEFLAIDEVQLANDPERGHIFTDRLLHLRGRTETLLLGAQTMTGAIADLLPGANFVSRPRLSKLTYAGQKKITRLPARTAVVAFSAGEVYSIAELIRRQRGGAAVVLGALSPRTRNAQVALYQSGDVGYMVATDAIGMGLNLDVDHVAFAGTRKFDGQVHRELSPAELAQIAGRAGRHMNDGTFGVTGDVEPFSQDIVERLESHTFDLVKVLQWRTRNLEFSSLERLRDSLRRLPEEPRLTRARMADDVAALELVSADGEVGALAATPAAVAKLWDVCQVPDYRRISPANHAELVAQLYKFLMTGEGRIPEDWFAKQVAQADRTDGDIDTLANRIAHIRTWTFVSNRSEWLRDPAHWQEKTRAIEDTLSDALHEQLTQRFVDRRTSALMKGMRDKDELEAEIRDDGAIHVENHYIGRLKGFHFSPDAAAEGIHGKATRSAASAVLNKELAMRARRVSAALSSVFKLHRSGRIDWQGEEIARLEPSDSALKPAVRIICDEHLQAPDKERVQQRLDKWIGDLIEDRLKPLVELSRAEDIQGLAKGIAFRMVECFGSLKRELAAEEVRSLDQQARAQLRRYGVRFGAFNIYLPLLLKPAPMELILVLWGLKNAAHHGLTAETMPEPPRAGLTSFVADKAVPEAYYRAAGYHLCGPRAVRVDMLERLADQIRPLMAWRAKPEAPDATPPKGSSGDGGFVLTPEMMSILGCSSSELGEVLKSLGFRLERRPVKPRPVVSPAAAPAPATGEAGAATAADAAAKAAGAAVALPETMDEDFTVEAADAEPARTAVPAVDDATAPLSDGSQAATGADLPAEPTPVIEISASAVSTEPAATASPTGEAAAADSTAPATAAQEAESAPAAGTVAALAEAEATSVEPAMEEVWRPRRRRPHGERRPRRGHEQRQSGQQVAAAGAEGAAAAPAADIDEGRDRKPAEARGRGRDRHDRDRNDSDRRGHGRRDRDRGKDGGAREQGGKPRGEGGDRRPGARGGDRRGEPRVIQSRPKPAGKGGFDPDSPFAALSQLKKQLEDQSPGRS